MGRGRKGPKSDVGLTKMAMWIDDNFYEPDRDEEKTYSYLYNIAYILAKRGNYFMNAEDYDAFSNFMAHDVFVRMTQSKIKSVLNYMNSVKNWRRMDYCEHFFSKVIKPEFDSGWDGDKYTNNCIYSLESKNKNILMNNMVESFRDFPKIIKDCIPTIYKADKLVYNNIYRSALLSFASRLTLPASKVEKIKINENNVKFDMAKYLNRYLKDDIVLWHLPESLREAVAITLNKSYVAMCDDIRESMAMFKVSYDDFKTMNVSELRRIFRGEEESDETVF